MKALYLKPALRSLRSRRFPTLLNVMGLALAMACCVVAFLYVRQELAYDRFHQHADEVFRVAVERRYQGNARFSALTPRSLAGVLRDEFPSVLQATRLSREHAARVLVQSAEERFYEEGVVFADPNVFEVFTLPLTVGDPSSALLAPRSIVISESMARKYFTGADPLGKTLALRLLGDGDLFDYTITGVARDMPAASHFHFDFLASYQGHPFTTTNGRERPSFENPDVYTYVRLQQRSVPARIEADIAQAVGRHSTFDVVGTVPISLSRNPATGSQQRYFLQPLADIHLRSNLSDEFQPVGSMSQLVEVAVIAGFILLLACINFANLSTALAGLRACETGMRMVFGSRRIELALQFLAEAAILSFIALLPALGLVELLLPGFNAFTGATLQLSLSQDLILLPILLAFAAFTAGLAGIYPACFLSARRPGRLLKFKYSAARSRLRDMLVILQFSVAIALMVATVVILSQLYFMSSRRLGFDQEQVLVLEGTEILKHQPDAFRQVVLGVPGVVAVANGENVPGRPPEMALVIPEGRTEGAQVGRMFTGFGYAETLGLQLVTGRTLSDAIPSDAMGTLLNEQAVTELNLEEPLGQRLAWDNRTYTVVGVVRDYHQTSLHDPIGPVMLVGPDPEFENRPYQFFMLRLRSADMQATLAALDEVWTRFAPQQPFAYTFLDDEIAALYGGEQVAGKMTGILALIAIFIACLGLYGLASFNAERRRKEIGVRKVLGSSVWSIVWLLTNDFSKLVLVSNLMAWPVAYVVMQRWLNSFAYHIDLTPLIFIGSGAIALCIAWVTVGAIAAKAASAKPVLALRYE
jgi:putative ABC transport system permease protein